MLFFIKKTYNFAYQIFPTDNKTANFLKHTQNEES